MRTHFRFTNDRLALDLLTTLGGRGDGRDVEKLRTPGDLARWFAESGLLDKAPQGLTEQDLESARQLREAVHRTATALLAERAVQRRDVALINETALAGPPVVALTAGAKSIRRSVASDQIGGACLAAVARDAVELLGGLQMKRVRNCANPACQALFLDLSRPGKRRWCSMGDGGCGNRAKTAASRSRRREESVAKGKVSTTDPAR